jgi:hypothetical protein
LECAHAQELNYNNENNSLKFEKSELVQCFFFFYHFLIINLKEFKPEISKKKAKFTLEKQSFANFFVKKW